MAELNELNEEEYIFSETLSRDVTTITLMRIYDILISQFALEHPKESSKLIELHKEGGLLNPAIGFDPDKIQGS